MSDSFDGRDRRGQRARAEDELELLGVLGELHLGIARAQRDARAAAADLAAG